MYRYKIIKKYSKFILGLICTFFICFISITTLAQAPNKAPVVIDGQLLFEVGDFGIFSAQERAQKINQALINTVKATNPISLEVVKLDNQVTIRDRASKWHLLTITQADIISAPTTYAQALIWQKRLEDALQKGKLERSTLYQSKALFITFGIFVLAIILHIALRCLRRFSYRKLDNLFTKKSRFSSWNKFLIPWEKLTILILQAIIWIAALFYISNLFPQSRNWLYWLFYWLNSPSISLGEKSYAPLEIVFLLSLTLAVWLIVKFLTNAFKYYVLRQIGAERAIQEIIAVIVQYILTFLALIILWQSWGLDLGALAITASVLGVGIGFGLQNITNNFISGLIITFESPIKIGDFIKVGEFIGTVKNIGFRSTEILTQDRIAIIIPNSELLENQVINWNHGDSISRLRIKIGVSYNSDIRKVKTALLYAAKNHAEVLRTPRPQVWLQSFADSSLDFELLVWIKDPTKQFRIKSDLNYLIAASLRQYNIEIPFPQRDINFSSPKLEQLLISWLGYQGINPCLSENNSPTTSKIPKIKADKAEDPFLSLEDKLTAKDLEQLVKQMRSVDGVKIRDRDYYLNFYRSCFVGSEAVDWLIKKYNYKREEAIELGQILLEKNIIHHVADEHSFKDAYLFYRFYADE